MNHRARKRFGQNFLVDDRVVERIIDTIRPAAGQLLIEIGPGQAALTRPLLESGAELHVIEIDRDLAAGLERRLGPGRDLHLHVADALKVDLAGISGGRRFRLLGNLPYNISTPLIFHALRWSGLILDMHFMLQREVVDRMAAAPGGRNRGKLSIMCQYHFEISPLFGVGPESFRPPPRVESSFVRLTPRKRPPVRIESMASFERLVSQAFSMRRKTLRNSLRGVLTAEQMTAAGVDPGLRPEALSLQQFAKLSQVME